MNHQSKYIKIKGLAIFWIPLFLGILFALISMGELACESSWWTARHPIEYEGGKN